MSNLPTTTIVWDDRTLAEYDRLVAMMRIIMSLQSANLFLDNCRTLIEMAEELEPGTFDRNGLLGQLKDGNLAAYAEIVERKKK